MCPLPLADHPRHKCLDRMRHPQQSHTHHPVPVFIGVLGERADGGYSGIVAEQVHLAEFGKAAVGQCTHLAAFGDVACDGQGFYAQRTDFGCDGFEQFTPGTGDRHIHAFAGKGQCQRTANAAAGANDDGVFSLQVVHAMLL
jgi:hypothetical protein